MKSKKALELLKQRIICAKGEEEFELLYKKYCEEIRKDLEVLEIIRNKSVDIGYIRLCMNVEGGLRKMYNYSIPNSNDELTEEEYETLVEWLKNDK